jgi:hypothetical protein
MLNYGVAINGIADNGLHLFEHLMTKAWVDLNSEHVVDINGSTFPTGISYIYIILDSEKSFQLYVNMLLVFINKIRKLNFWSTQQAQSYLRIETQRTISETREERILNTVGRTDQKGYNYEYNTDIFLYWANQPFNIFLVSKTDHDIAKTNVLKRNIVHRPPNIKFSRMPLDVIKAKTIQKTQITKIKTNDIIDQVFSHDLKNVLYGLNCSLYSDREDMIKYNNILLPLLFLSRFVSIEKIKEYISKNIIPINPTLFGIIPVQLDVESLFNLTLNH